MVGAHQIAVAGLEVLEDNVAPVEELIEALGHLASLGTDLAVGLVELEEECCLVENLHLRLEAMHEFAHRLHLWGEEGACRSQLAQVMAEEGEGTLRGEDEAQVGELFGPSLIVVGRNLLEEGGGMAH